MDGSKTADFYIASASHVLATHYFLRLTRARGKSSQREGNALFDDFWYFWSRKSTIREKVSLCLYTAAASHRPTHKAQVQPTEKAKNIYFIPSALLLYPRPLLFFQRACGQCVHESARLPRVICSHAWSYEIAESGKTTDLCFAPRRTHLPRMACTTDSCTRKKIFKRMENPLK